MNARVSQTCDYINNDRPLPDNDAILIDTPLLRVSRELTSNRFGDYLLDICKSTNLRIVNGRLNGDQGKWTCITHNGQSVVDYVITSCDTFSTLVDFQVHDFNEFSNNAPLSFSFKTQTYRRETNCKRNKYYKFDSKYRDEFIHEVLIGVADFERDLSSEIQNNGDFDILTTIFTDLKFGGLTMLIL